MTRLSRKPLSEQPPKPLPVLRIVRCFMCNRRIFDRREDFNQVKSHVLGIEIKCVNCGTINRF